MRRFAKRIFICLFLVTVVAIALSSCTKNDGTLEYKAAKGGLEVVGLADGDAKDVKVPMEYKGKKVVSVGEGAFRGTNIESICVPPTVKSFGLNAFEFCASLNKVVLEDARSFADADFANEYANPLSNGAELYEGGNKIEELALNSEAVSNYAYAGASSIKVLTLSGVKNIGEGAFKNCASLASVNFGDKLETVGVSAFSGAAIEELTLPEGVKSVGHSAFSSNKALVSVTLPASLTELCDRVFFSCSALESINLDNVKSIGVGAFYDCVSIREVKLPAVTTKIDDYAFYNCSGLGSFEIPENSALELIGESAFRGCTALRDMYLDRAGGLKSIGAHAFEYCIALENLTLPTLLEELGDWAFASCSALYLTEKEGVGYIGNEEAPYILVYKHVNDEVTNVNIQPGAKFIHQGAFAGKKTVTNIYMSSGVVSIGSQAFSFCTGLKEITISKTLKTLGDGALMGCKSLEKVRFKGSSAQWTDSKNENYVKKGSNWNFNAGSYKIYYG